MQQIIQRTRDGGAVQMTREDTGRFNEVRGEWEILNQRVADLRTEARARDVAAAALRNMPAPATGPRFIRLSDGRPAAVERGASFLDHPVVPEARARQAAREAAIVGQHGNLGMLLRAMTDSSGSAIVPTIWSSQIIDRARNLAAVTRAGAQLVPMEAKTVQIGRLTGDPTAAFRGEGDEIDASDPTFDNVTLEAKTMSALVVGSLEWFQDAPNAEDVVVEAIAKAVALQLDLVCLFGGMEDGDEGFDLATPPNPRGILASLLADAESSVLGGEENGTAQTEGSFYDEVVQAILHPADLQ